MARFENLDCLCSLFSTETPLSHKWVGEGPLGHVAANSGEIGQHDLGAASLAAAKLRHVGLLVGLGLE